VRPYLSLIIGVSALFSLLLLLRLFPLEPLAPYLIPIVLLYLPLLVDRSLGRKDLGLHVPERESWLPFFSSSLIFLGGMVLVTKYLLFWSWKGFPPPFFRLGVNVVEEVIFRSLPEEFYFRGWLQKRCERFGSLEIFRFGGGKIDLANLAVSALFAILHWLSYGGPERLLVFFPSLWFGWLRSCGGGLLLPVLAHALSNLLLRWGQGW